MALQCALEGGRGENWAMAAAVSVRERGPAVREGVNESARKSIWLAARTQ